jgi:putative hemolysin
MNNSTMPLRPLIDLDAVIKKGSLLAILKPLLSKILSIREINEIYATVHAGLTDSDYDPHFFKKTLKAMAVHFELNEAGYARIPKKGKLIVVANHPFGGIDGVILGALLQGLRPDSKLMGNYLLSQMEGIRGNIINVDPFETANSVKANLDGIRQAIQHLRAGGCLGLFPAGEVSSFQWSCRAVADRNWTQHIVKLALKTEAPVLPVYFEGRNSLLFQIAGLIHPRLRTVLLAREFCNTQQRELGIQVGNVIKQDELRRFKSLKAANDYLRLETYALKKDFAKVPKSQKLRFPFRATSSLKVPTQLALPQPKHLMQSEINNLPSSNLIVQHGDLQVYCAYANEISSVLKEIGRLREETFRDAQEGTGRAEDLDDFDKYYLHLFIWNNQTSEVAGAYRMGLVEDIVKKYGKRGLYTNTLFKFRSRFIDELGSAIELGRSFISLKYQRKHATLPLLIKGITIFCAQRPKHKILFGPVSITDAYRSISKKLMVHFFQENNFNRKLSQMVRAKRPPKASDSFLGVSLKSIAESIRSVDAFSAIISNIEDDDKGIPVLLKHYLKLNGALLSFNVDPAFSDVIDGLIVVDLTKSEPRMMARHMGKDNYTEFMDYHQQAARLLKDIKKART